MARYLKLKSWRGPACYLLPFFILLSIILVLLKNNEELRTQLDSCNCTPCAHAVLAATKSDWLKEEDTYFDDGYFRFLEGVTNNPAHWNHLLAAYQPHVKETDVVLDFGAGGGFALHRLRARVKLGVDIMAAARAFAWREYGLRLNASICDVPDGSLDVIVTSLVLVLVDHPMLVLRLLREKLKPGGRIYAKTRNVSVKPEAYSSVKQTNTRLYGFNANMFGQLFERAGYVVDWVKASDAVEPDIEVLAHR